VGLIGWAAEGRHATTRWAFASQLERLGAWYLRKRWVEDGKFICSEGVSAGIDRALDLGAKLTNEELLARRSSCLFQVRFSHRIG
jgi:transcriptional regulator GlxA family with amidase domain